MSFATINLGAIENNHNLNYIGNMYYTLVGAYLFQMGQKLNNNQQISLLSCDQVLSILRYFYHPVRVNNVVLKKIDTFDYQQTTNNVELAYVFKNDFLHLQV